MLITGSCKTDMGYFRIRLNRFNVVETITCFNKKVKKREFSFFSFFFKIKVRIKLIFRISKWIIYARCGENTRAC